MGMANVCSISFFRRQTSTLPNPNRLAAEGSRSQLGLRAGGVVLSANSSESQTLLLHSSFVV